jgi:two-component system response regulator AlgR
MPSESPLKILLVDDEPLARDRLRTLLADIAIQLASEVVGEAGNGLEALEFLREHPVDVVLADIRMPGMDGIELAGHLGAFEQPPAVIFTTAYDNYAVQAFDLNAVDYLLKPVRDAAPAHRLAKGPATTSSTRPSAGRHRASIARRWAHPPFLPRTRPPAAGAGVGGALFQGRSEICHGPHGRPRIPARRGADPSRKEFAERFIRLHRAVLVAKTALAGFEKAAGDDADAYGWALLRGVPEKLPVSRRQWVPAKAPC